MALRSKSEKGTYAKLEREGKWEQISVQFENGRVDGPLLRVKEANGNTKNYYCVCRCLFRCEGLSNTYFGEGTTVGR